MVLFGGAGLERCLLRDSHRNAGTLCLVCRGNISTSFMAAKFPPGEIQPSDATHFEVRWHVSCWPAEGVLVR